MDNDIAAEQAGTAVLFQTVAHRAKGVPGRVNGLNVQSPEYEGLAAVELDIGFAVREPVVFRIDSILYGYIEEYGFWQVLLVEGGNHMGTVRWLDIKNKGYKILTMDDNTK